MPLSDTDKHSSYTVTVRTQSDLGAALPNVSVSWFVDGENTTGTTDSSGTLEIDNVGKNSQVTVSADDPGYLFSPAQQEVTVSQDCTLTFVGSAISVSGETDAITGSASAPQKPLAGVTVQVTGSFADGSAGKTVVSSSVGSYKVSGLMVGETYQVLGSIDDYTMLQGANGASFTVGSNIPSPDIKLSLLFEKNDSPDDPIKYVFLAIAGVTVSFGVVGLVYNLLFTNMEKTLAQKLIDYLGAKLSSIGSTDDAASVLTDTPVGSFIPDGGSAATSSVLDGSASGAEIADAVDALSPYVEQYDAFAVSRAALAACSTRNNFVAWLNSLSDSDIGNLVSSDIVGNSTFQDFASDLTSFLTDRGVLAAPTESSEGFATGFVGSDSAGALDAALNAADESTGYALSGGLTEEIVEDLGLDALGGAEEGLVDMFLIVADITLCA